MYLGMALMAVDVLSSILEIMRMGKSMREAIKRRRSGYSGSFDVPVEEESSLKAVIGGSLGSQLVSAFMTYVREGDLNPLKASINKISGEKEVDVVVDVLGRNPEVMYLSQFGREPHYLYKLGSTITPDDFPTVSRGLAKFLEMVNNLHPKAKKRALLVTTVAIAFQAGQLIGGTAKYHLLHLDRGKGYVEVPAVIWY